jgi:hypothetical protein
MAKIIPIREHFPLISMLDAIGSSLVPLLQRNHLVSEAAIYLSAHFKLVNRVDLP